MGKAKRRCIITKRSDTGERGCIRRSRQQQGEQRVFPRAIRIHIIDLSGLVIANVRPQDLTCNVHHRVHRQHAFRGNFGQLDGEG